MANRAQAWSDNVSGPWFVDQTCIDCGVCRWVAPDTFGDAEDHAYVHAQPADPTRAAMAAIACPVGSIGGPAEALRTHAFPEEVLPGVYFCGWTQRETYGAAAWLIARGEGNVLVDVPRPNPGLLDRIAALGGVRMHVLTHRDDVHEHVKFTTRFGCERVMHAADIDRSTADVERKIEGVAPVELAPDLLLVPVPGHTAGSIALLSKEDILFSGDHLWGAGPVGWHAEGAQGVPALAAGRSVCWSSWPEQIRSMERLLDVPFAHVLPAHGRPWHEGAAARRPALEALLGWMRRV